MIEALEEIERGMAAEVRHSNRHRNQNSEAELQTHDVYVYLCVLYVCADVRESNEWN